MEDTIMNTTDHLSRKQFMKYKAKQKAGWIIGGIFLAVFLAFIFGYFVMLLWNWVMPQIFGLPVIDYWLAFGIIILARLIFGGLGSGHSNNKSSHHDRFSSSKFKRRFSRDCRPKNKWSHYEDYWKEEGEQAFNDYVSRKSGSEESKAGLNEDVIS